MTRDNVSIGELERSRTDLLTELGTILTRADKQFLMSIYDGVPAWDKLGLEGVDQLPAIQWKLANVSRMSETKRTASQAKLAAILR